MVAFLAGDPTQYAACYALTCIATIQTLNTGSKNSRTGSPARRSPNAPSRLRHAAGASTTKHTPRRARSAYLNLQEACDAER